MIDHHKNATHENKISKYSEIGKKDMRKFNDHLFKNDWVDTILSFYILTGYRHIS